MNERFKVFICQRAMHMGGAEKALLELLSSYDYSKTEVHLGLLEKTGVLLPQVPKDVIIDDIVISNDFNTLRIASPYDSLKLLWKRKHFFSCLAYVILYYLQKHNPANRVLFYQYFLRGVQLPTMCFDEAHCFYGVDDLLSFIVAYRIKAATKCNWIHVDVSKGGFNKTFFNTIANKYQKYYIVSRQGKDIFDTLFPALMGKTEVRYNIIPQKRIRALSLSGPSFNDEFAGKRILTIGRISPEKGQRIALAALRILTDEGINIRWYFIGDGADLVSCLDYAEQLGVSGNAYFLGNQINPYGYLKDCDLYVQPSRNEGFCISLGEALCLNKPIVSTDFVGAKEQLEGDTDAMIVSCSPLELAEGIKASLQRIR